MSIITMLHHLGADNIQYQNLDDTLVGMHRKHDNVQYAFISDQAFNGLMTDKLGLVLWLDRDKLPAAKEAVETGGDPLQEQLEKQAKAIAASRATLASLLGRAGRDTSPGNMWVTSAAQHALSCLNDLGETIIDRRLRGLEEDKDRAEERRDHWFQEREKELDENERLRKRAEGLNRIISAAECNYPDVEQLSDSDARETLVNLCQMILEERGHG